jgi:hypothetical protein
VFGVGGDDGSTGGATDGSSGGSIGGGKAGARGRGRVPTSAVKNGGEKDTDEPQNAKINSAISTAEVNESAAKALMLSLQQKFSLVRSELKRPSVIKAMRRHHVQAIDDQGEVYGSGYPKPGRKLIYDRKEDRLKPESGPAQ